MNATQRWFGPALVALVAVVAVAAGTLVRSDTRAQGAEPRALEHAGTATEGLGTAATGRGLDGPGSAGGPAAGPLAASVPSDTDAADLGGISVQTQTAPGVPDARDYPFWPALTVMHATGPGAPGVDGAQLSDRDTCARCHTEVAAQWETSAHAHSSFNNPVYRVSIEGLRQRVGARASRMCGGCHDPALLIDGALDQRVAPEDPRGHAGITCNVCHGVAAVTPFGNGSYALRDRPLAVPQRGTRGSLARHRQDAALHERENALCVSCHRSFVGRQTGNAHHLVGMDEASAWQNSPYAGQGSMRIDTPVAQADCVACHMPRVPVGREEAARGTDGRVQSHAFLGGHSYLAAMRGDTATAAAVARQLRGVARVDIAALSPSPTTAQSAPRPVASGQATLPWPLPSTLQVDVALRNLGVGHRFPGGVLDAQDTWLQLQWLDAAGRVVAVVGPDPAAAKDTDALDDRHVLRALAVDRTGALLQARQVDAIAAVVANHTLPPRDVAVVRLSLTVPAALDGGPVALRARLLHRSRNLVLQQAACEDAKRPRGRAFARASQALGRPALDPCVPQPVTEIAHATVQLTPAPGRGRATVRSALSVPAPRWQRLFEYGLGLSHDVTEALPAARRPLLAALAMLQGAPDADAHATVGAGADRRAQAAVLAALAELDGRTGRTDAARARLSQARALWPAPALDRIEAEALRRVWRFADALPYLQALTAATPKSSDAWSLLAQTRGALGDPAAVAVAARGLRLQPHHRDLLRVWALGLSAQGAPQAGAALSLYATVDAGDQAQRRARFAAALGQPSIAGELDPIHVHGGDGTAANALPSR